MAKKKDTNVLPKLTRTEQDLIANLQHGYELETDSLGGNPVLRRLKDEESNTARVRESQYDKGAGRSRPDPVKQRPRAAYSRVASEEEPVLR